MAELGLWVVSSFPLPGPALPLANPTPVLPLCKFGSFIPPCLLPLPWPLRIPPAGRNAPCLGLHHKYCCSQIAAQFNLWVCGSPSKVPRQTHGLPAFAPSLDSSLPRVLIGLPAATSAIGMASALPPTRLPSPPAGHQSKSLQLFYL